MAPEYDPENLYTLTDETGKEQTFELLDVMDVQGKALLRLDPLLSRRPGAAGTAGRPADYGHGGGRRGGDDGQPRQRRGVPGDLRTVSGPVPAALGAGKPRLTPPGKFPPEATKLSH